MARVSFFYAVGPLAIIVSTAVLLTIPYLAFLVFMIVALVVLAGLGWAIVAVPYILVRAIRRHWVGQIAPYPQPVPILSPVTQQTDSLDRPR